MINKKLVKTLIKNHLTISTVESFTGGLAAKKIVDIPGSSRTFLGGIVTYSTLIKEYVLGVDKSLIDKYCVASKEVALDMAKKGKEMFMSDIVISFTGEAGPISSSGVKVGTVFIGIYFLDQLEVYELHIKKSRKNVRKSAVNYAFKKIFKKFSQK